MKVKNKRLRQVSDLRAWHYVVYRSIRTGKRKKFDSRVRVYAEVWSKRSGKRIGYVNKVVEGKAIPRRFSNKARLIYHEGRKASKSRIDKTYERFFNINYNNWIPDQIPEWVSELFNSEVKKTGTVQFVLRMTGKDNKGISRDIKSNPYRSDFLRIHKYWVDTLTTIIVQALRGNQIRTSPKKYSKSRYWFKGKNIAEFHYLKKYKVEIILQKKR